MIAHIFKEVRPYEKDDEDEISDIGNDLIELRHMLKVL